MDDKRRRVLEEVKRDRSWLRRVDVEFRNDKEIVLEAVKQYGPSLRYASEELRSDKEVVLEAVKQYGPSLRYASEELRSDKEVVLEAVKQNGFSLAFASEELQSDKEVVLEAVKQYGPSLEYASEELREDKDFYLEAVKQKVWSLEYARSEGFRNKEALLEALKKDGRLLRFASKELRRDKENVLAAVKKHGPVLQYASDELRYDREVVIAAMESIERMPAFFCGMFSSANFPRYKVKCSRKTRNKYFLVEYAGGYNHKEGKKEGRGFLFGHEGRKLVVNYEGEFHNDQKHGLGKSYKTIKRGFFSTGERVLSHEGAYVDGHKEGKGVEYEFVDGRNWGVYEGMFKNDRFHGKGQEYDPIKRIVINGEWKNGKVIPGSEHRFKFPILKRSEYEVLEKHLVDRNRIGFGGNGIIYQMNSRVLKRYLPDCGIDYDQEEFVAVKVMPCGNSFHREMLFATVKRGMEGISRVRKNKELILEHYAAFSEANKEGKLTVGYVMKKCKHSLDAVIEGSNFSLPLEDKIQILHDVAKGMFGLHSAGIMHRDLKWGNILMSEENRIKITDFDTAREDESLWKWNIQSFSIRNIGTTSFLAPEIYEGKDYGLSVDVYSFGIMIYSILFELNQPYASQYQCSCGTTITEISKGPPELQQKKLMEHICKHDFRPLLDPKELKKFPQFLIDLMTVSWDRDPSKRLSFEDIVKIFENEKKKTKCYSIMTLKFPKHANLKTQKMFLVKPKYEKIVSWIENKFEDSKVLHLDNKTVGSLREDKDVFLLIEKEENPIIDVELDKVSQVRFERPNSRSTGFAEENLKLKKENEKLRRENLEVERLRKEVEEVDRLKRENEELRRMLVASGGRSKKVEISSKKDEETEGEEED